MECYDYLPFGRMLESGSHGRGCCYPNPPDVGYSSRTPQKFTGKERDAETGLDYFGARYYSGAQGRFLSVDPGNAGASLDNPQSWNGYSYALNSPLRYVDPDGLAPDCYVDGISVDCSIAQGYLRSGAGVLIPDGMPLTFYDHSAKSYRTLQADATGALRYDYRVPPSPSSADKVTWQGNYQVTVEATSDSSFSFASVGVLAPAVPWALAEPTPIGEVILGIAAGGILGYQAVTSITNYFAKGGNQNVLPSWVKERPKPGQSGKEFAKEQCDKKYPEGYDTGPGSDFSDKEVGR